MTAPASPKCPGTPDSGDGLPYHCPGCARADALEAEVVEETARRLWLGDYVHALVEFGKSKSGGVFTGDLKDVGEDWETIAEAARDDYRRKARAARAQKDGGA